MVMSSVGTTFQKRRQSASVDSVRTIPKHSPQYPRGNCPICLHRSVHRVGRIAKLRSQRPEPPYHLSTYRYTSLPTSHELVRHTSSLPYHHYSPRNRNTLQAVLVHPASRPVIVSHLRNT